MRKGNLTENTQKYVFELESINVFWTLIKRNCTKSYYKTFGKMLALIHDIKQCYFVYDKDVKVMFKNSFHWKYLCKIFTEEIVQWLRLGSA